MKRAIIETAAVVLRCPHCDVMLRNQDGARTWGDEHFTDQVRTTRCLSCTEEVELPTKAEVFPLL